MPYRLAKAHLVCKDAVQSVLVQGDDPLDALQLVRSQLPLYERHQLLLHLHQNTTLFFSASSLFQLHAQPTGLRRLYDEKEGNQTMSKLRETSISWDRPSSGLTQRQLPPSSCCSHPACPPCACCLQPGCWHCRPSLLSSAPSAPSGIWCTCLSGREACPIAQIGPGLKERSLH